MYLFILALHCHFLAATSNAAKTLWTSAKPLCNPTSAVQTVHYMLYIGAK